MTLAADRRFDVVVFGATSFVGQILCKHLVARHGVAGEGINWAIAGRSASKLAEVAKSTGANVEQIVADASDVAAMTALVRSTKLVISTVGPYRVTAEKGKNRTLRACWFSEGSVFGCGRLGGVSGPVVVAGEDDVFPAERGKVLE